MIPAFIYVVLCANSPGFQTTWLLEAKAYSCPSKRVYSWDGLTLRRISR